MHHLTVRTLSFAALALAIAAGCGGGGSSGTGPVPVRSIPSGALLYSLPSGTGSTLYYFVPGSAAPVPVTTFSQGVTVFGANPGGTRLVLSKPLGGTDGKSGLYTADLDGGDTVRMEYLEVDKVNDASITARGDVVDGTSDAYNVFSPSGANYGNGLGAQGGCVSASSNGLGTEAVYVILDRIYRSTLPGRESEVQLVHGGSYSWVRFSKDGTRIAYADGTDIYTMGRDGSGQVKAVTGGGYPTFGPTSTALYFSRQGDGIYSKDLATGAETRVLAVPGAWDGKFVWH